nr:hypothetical protein [Tanacetum cinerariifolium]
MKWFEYAIFKQREEINDRMAEMFGLLKELTAIRTPKKEEKNIENNGAIDKSMVAPSKSDEEEPPKEVDMTNEVERRANDKPTKSARENVAKNEKEEPAGVSRIAEDVLVDVIGYVYLVDFVILDIKKDEKSPFILGTPFLTTTKAMIKFAMGTITLSSRKSKISFHRIPEPHYRIEKGTKNDIEPIAPTVIFNRLVLEWEEKIKLHQEKRRK